MVISLVLGLCLLFTLTSGNTQSDNSLLQLSKLFSNLQEIHDTKQTQLENAKDQTRSDTRKGRGEIGLILALGAPVHAGALENNKKDENILKSKSHVCITAWIQTSNNNSEHRNAKLTFLW